MSNLMRRNQERFATSIGVTHPQYLMLIVIGTLLRDGRGALHELDAPHQRDQRASSLNKKT
jgi:hypothetical protein